MILPQFLILLFSIILASTSHGKKGPTDFKPVEGEDVAESVAVSESESEKPKLKDTEEVLTGTVTVMRKITLTEAFFKDLKESYYIPAGSKNYPIFKAFTESSKKGTAVTFKVNKKSRQVISMEDAPANPVGISESGSKSKSGSK